MPIGIDISRSSVPLVRSRSIAIEVTRNIDVKGRGRRAGRRSVERLLLSVEDVAEQGEQERRDDEDERERARVAAELAEDPLGCRECQRGTQVASGT